MADQETTRLDGKAVSAKVLDALKLRIESEKLSPHLHVISVGQDVASNVFIKQKRNAAEKIGVTFSQTSLPVEATLSDLRRAVLNQNKDPSVSGIIVQLPLPESLQSHEREVLNLVDPMKDVDCFHPKNFGQLALGQPVFKPATPAGILRLLEHYGVETRGKQCVVLGKSNIVGKPLGLLLAHEEGPAATVTLCDKYTENVWDLTRKADILVVAAGKHHLVHDPGVLRPDGKVTIIDVGIHRVQTAEGKTVVQGDVDSEAVKRHCRWLTPVPGGVGPMTVACLLEQVVEACALLTDPRNKVKHLFVENTLRTGGRLTRVGVCQLLERLEPGFPVAELNSKLGEMDPESTGYVSLDDFLDWALAVRTN